MAWHRQSHSRGNEAFSGVVGSYRAITQLEAAQCARVYRENLEARNISDYQCSAARRRKSRMAAVVAMLVDQRLLYSWQLKICIEISLYA